MIGQCGDTHQTGENHQTPHLGPTCCRPHYSSPIIETGCFEVFPVWGHFSPSVAQGGASGLLLAVSCTRPKGLTAECTGVNRGMETAATPSMSLSPVSLHFLFSFHFLFQDASKTEKDFVFFSHYNKTRRLVVTQIPTQQIQRSEFNLISFGSAYFIMSDKGPFEPFQCSRAGSCPVDNVW